MRRGDGAKLGRGQREWSTGAEERVVSRQRPPISRPHVSRSPVSPSLYSYLSAIIGSVLVARNAGTKHAAIATQLNTNDTATNVSRSVAPTL